MKSDHTTKGFPSSRPTFRFRTAEKSATPSEAKEVDAGAAGISAPLGPAWHTYLTISFQMLLIVVVLSYLACYITILARALRQTHALAHASRVLEFVLSYQLCDAMHVRAYIRHIYHSFLDLLFYLSFI